MRPRLPLVLALIAACSAPVAAHAFDTGHHADLTRDAMLAEGFPQSHANAALVMNWLTDYYSNTAERQSDLSLLHFDNLTTPGMTQDYWDTFTINSQIAVANAAREHDSLKLLALLGISLHTVQDFYTHSNWVEIRQPSLQNNPYSTKTWFDYPPDQRGVTGLRTGNYPNGSPIGARDHGDYVSGMNHDSYCRPRWDEAYVYAYAASRHWIRTFEKWAEAAQPGAWAQVRGLFLDPGLQGALASEQLAAYRVSEWVSPVDGTDGHWKGSGSGSSSDFGTFMSSYKLRARTRFAQFLMADKIDLELSKGLASPTAPVVPVPGVATWQALDQLAVSVRTNFVGEVETGTWESRMDGGFSGDPDFYAMVTVDGLTYVEAMQQDKASVRPYWNTLRFVPKSQAASDVRYVLYDEDNPPSNPDDSCDVNPKRGVTDLRFTIDLRTGMIQGSIPPSVVLNSQGERPDADRAKVSLTTRCVALQDVAPPADSIAPPTPISNLGTGEERQPGFASNGRVEGDGYWFEWRNLEVYRADLHVQFELDLRGGSTSPSGNRAAFRLTLDDTNLSVPLFSGDGVIDFRHFEGAFDVPPDPEDSREVNVVLVGTFPGISRGQRDGDSEDVPDFDARAMLGTLRW